MTVHNPSRDPAPTPARDRGRYAGPVGGNLTDREWTLLRALATGLTADAIARDQGVGRRVLVNRITAIHEKMGLPTTLLILLLLDDYRPGWRPRATLS